MMWDDEGEKNEENVLLTPLHGALFLSSLCYVFHRSISLSMIDTV